jgi:hypothetical protein
MKTIRRPTGICLRGITLFLLLMTAGCITIREGQLQPITQWPPERKSGKQTISLAVKGKVIYNGQEVSQDVTKTKLLYAWQDLTVRAYQESGLFSDVKTEPADTDLRAEITIIDRGDNTTVRTLYLIPSSATDAVTVSTTLKDRHGAVIGNFQKQEAHTLWQHVFLIFAMPFRSTEQPLVYDLNRATILEALANGSL